MKTFSTSQLIGIILIGTALIDVFILPKILLKKINQDTGPTTTPQQKADIERKRKIMKLIITIITSFTAIIGLLIFLGIIPIENS